MPREDLCRNKSGSKKITSKLKANIKCYVQRESEDTSVHSERKPQKKTSGPKKKDNRQNWAIQALREGENATTSSPALLEHQQELRSDRLQMAMLTT